MHKTGNCLIFAEENSRDILNFSSFINLNMIDENGKINFEQLRQTADKILNGTARINILSLEEEKGRARGGRENVEASILLAANERPNGEKRANAATRQENLLIEYANEKGVWIDPDKFKNPINEGDEAKVFPSPTMGYVLKVFDYKRFSKTPLEFLTNRISLHNYIFPDTAYTLIGFTTTEDFTGRQTFAFVVEQLFVQGSYIHPTERMETLIPEMIKLGFKYKIENLKPIFFNKEYIIRDLHERNILITQEGNLRFIDTVPELNVPTSGFGGIREYGDGRINSDKSNIQL